MSDLNNKYKNIINEIEEKIKNPEELEFVKGKFTELSVFFIDIIDKLTSMTDARLSEIEENQREIDNRILKVQNIVNNIEDDIYSDDENYEFEIICPYCNYQFIADVDSEINEEKTTRSMEIIISNVSPKIHFLSKIISSNLFLKVNMLNNINIRNIQ